MYIKAILIGMSGVGKTRFVNILRQQKADATYTPTIGVDFFVYNELQSGVIFQLWDTSGERRYVHIVETFMNGIDICIFVYNDRKSFEAMMEMIRVAQVKRYGKRYCILSFDLHFLGEAVANKYGFCHYGVNISSVKSCLNAMCFFAKFCEDEIVSTVVASVDKKRDAYCWFSFW